ALARLDTLLVFVDGEEVDLTLNQLDPDRIERIEVLKGAATARFGERGAHGGVFVTTSNAPDAPDAPDAPPTGPTPDIGEPEDESSMKIVVAPGSDGPSRVISGEIPEDVEVYLDGVRYEGSLDDLDPDRIDRIEVIKTPGARRIQITLK